MEIRTPLEDGYLPPEYSKQAPPENTLENTPVVSPPIFITDVAAEAQSLALIMLDHDAIPVSGFTWIHWVTLITDPTMTELPEGISQLNPEYLVQGNNSNAGRMVNMKNIAVTESYTGPQPPDVDHEYQFELIALDNVPDVKPGFWLNELYHKLAGHEVDHATFKFMGKK